MCGPQALADPMCVATAEPNRDRRPSTRLIDKKGYEICDPLWPSGIDDDHAQRLGSHKQRAGPAGTIKPPAASVGGELGPQTVGNIEPGA